MKELLKKIALAKKEIKNSKMTKLGKNKFSNYDYFTPEQIEKLVFDACENNGLITTFNLKRNEFGVYGILTIYDTESSEKLEYEMASAIPEIKATNIAQQLGGCVTYTERYLKTSAFGIVDNSLDFDNDNNSPANPKNTKKEEKINYEKLPIAIKEAKEAQSIEELTSVWNKYKEFRAYEQFEYVVKTRTNELK